MVPEVAGSIPVAHPPVESIVCAGLSAPNRGSTTRPRIRRRKNEKGVDTLTGLVTFKAFAASGCWTAAAAFCSKRSDWPPKLARRKSGLREHRMLIENRGFEI